MELRDNFQVQTTPQYPSSAQRSASERGTFPNPAFQEQVGHVTSVVWTRRNLPKGGGGGAVLTPGLLCTCTAYVSARCMEHP